MRIVTLSDIHGMYSKIDVPDGDVLVFAGDITDTGTIPQLERFNDWVITLPHKYKIVVAGNHDIGFEDSPYKARVEMVDCVYLEDSSITIEGVKFYGTPWQPEFFNWAFNLPRGTALADKWSYIPDDTDVLITHGPPYGVLDTNKALDDPRREHFGCVDLLNRVKQVEPKYHIFGHIHGGYGMATEGKTTFVNTAICTESYKPTNKPWVIDYDTTLCS